MSISFSRALRRTGVLCLVVVALLATALGSRAATTTATTRSARTLDVTVRTTRDGDVRGFYSSKPMTLRADGQALTAYPPSKTASARPMTVVYLHGAHGRADNGCPWFRAGTSELGWLVCPEAIEEQPDGSWSWGADVFEQSPVVKRALRAAVAQGSSPEPGVAVGFSQGSYVALDLVNARLAKFRGLVLLGAELHPSAKTLHDAGVQRVALGAGSLDGAYASLVEEAQRLATDGLEVRFFDLGRVGHTYAAENTTALHDAITWAGGL